MSDITLILIGVAILVIANGALSNSEVLVHVVVGILGGLIGIAALYAMGIAAVVVLDVLL